MDNHFDAEKFIVEIENRPALWNSACGEYSNRDVKRKCWEELTVMFSSENITVQEKKEIRINLQRKWKSLRDCFSRELSRIKKLKSGSETPRKNAYVFYNQLLFLKPIIQNKPTETNVIPDANESGDDLGDPSTCQVSSNSEPKSKKKKTTSTNPLEKEIIDALHKSVGLREEQTTKKYEEDADRLFLLSLLKPLKEIPEPLRFSVKMDLMKTINNARINSHSAFLTISHLQRYTPGSQNVVSYINQDQNTKPTKSRSKLSKGFTSSIERSNNI